MSSMVGGAAVAEGLDSSKAARVIGWVLTGLVAAFMVMDAGMKLALAAPSVDATRGLGFPVGVVFWLGLVQAICLALYLTPRTAVLGALLMTGYLGGAVAANVRAQTPVFNVLFPLIFATMLWAGLWLRDARLRRLVPLRTE